jgi:large subunit ribosomal protein L25
MAGIASMSAEPRTALGKGGARATRRAGRVPAVVYGGSHEPVAVSVDGHDVAMEYNRAGFFSRLYDLEVGQETMRVLPREVQAHPVSDAPLHIDFLRLTAETRIDVEVAVGFANDEEAPGLRRGGVLNIVRHAVELNCRADSIPESITVDLSGLEIGDSVHISGVPLPEGVRPTITDRDFTIATIAAPTVVREEAAAEAAEAAEEEIAAVEEEAEAVPGEEAAGEETAGEQSKG